MNRTVTRGFLESAEGMDTISAWEKYSHSTYMYCAYFLLRSLGQRECSDRLSMQLHLLQENLTLYHRPSSENFARQSDFKSVSWTKGWCWTIAAICFRRLSNSKAFCSSFCRRLGLSFGYTFSSSRSIGISWTRIPLELSWWTPVICHLSVNNSTRSFWICGFMNEALL